MQVARIDSRPLAGELNGLFAAEAGWERAEPIGQAVMIDRATTYHGINAITVRDRPMNGLEHDDAGTLANISIGPIVERLAAAVRRHHARLAEGDGQIGRWID